MTNVLELLLQLLCLLIGYALGMFRERTRHYQSLRAPEPEYDPSPGGDHAGGNDHRAAGAHRPRGDTGRDHPD